MVTANPLTLEPLAKQLADAKKAYYRAMKDGDPIRIHLTDRALMAARRAVEDDLRTTKHPRNEAQS